MKKISDDFSEDAMSYEEPSSAWYAAEKQREDDLRIRMFALDMAINALPTLLADLSITTDKLAVLRQAAAEFEKIIRGES